MSTATKTRACQHTDGHATTELYLSCLLARAPRMDPEQRHHIARILWSQS